MRRAWEVFISVRFLMILLLTRYYSRCERWRLCVVFCLYQAMWLQLVLYYRWNRTLNQSSSSTDGKRWPISKQRLLQSAVSKNGCLKVHGVTILWTIDLLCFQPVNHNRRVALTCRETGAKPLGFIIRMLPLRLVSVWKNEFILQIHLLTKSWKNFMRLFIFTWTSTSTMLPCDWPCVHRTGIH